MQTTWCGQPSVGHGPRHVAFPGGAVVSVTCPALHFPLTFRAGLATQSPPVTDQIRWVTVSSDELLSLQVNSRKAGAYLVENAWRERLTKLSERARLSAEAADDDRVKRNQAIVEADDAGVAIKEIARVAAMSPAHVQRILIAATADRQADADTLEGEPSWS